jgi:hypothetical protein
MFSQGERRFHGTEYSCNCSARSNELLMKYFRNLFPRQRRAGTRWNIRVYRICRLL